MKPLLLVLLLAACSSGGTTTHVRGTGEADPRLEVRIDNHNWGIAKVYIRSAYSTVIGQRIATVSGLTRTVVWVRPPVTFVFYVTFIGDRRRWDDYEVWEDFETCLRLTIENHVAASGVIPCFDREK